MTSPLKMDDAKALAVLDEVIKQSDQAMPTPLNRRGESAMNIDHYCSYLWDIKQARAYFADKLAKAEALAEAAEPFSTFVCDDPMKTIGMAIPVLRRAIAAYRSQTP